MGQGTPRGTWIRQLTDTACPGRPSRGKEPPGPVLALVAVCPLCRRKVGLKLDLLKIFLKNILK